MDETVDGLTKLLWIPDQIGNDNYDLFYVIPAKAGIQEEFNV